MEINEVYMESEFIMGGESYCRKCIFYIPEIDLYKFRTTVTYVNSEEMSLVDGFVERFFEGTWHHIHDSLPKEGTMENIKLVQKELVKVAAKIIHANIDTNNIDESKYKMFKWDDLEAIENKEEENLLTLEFNPKKI